MKLTEPNELIDEYCGTPNYISPEIVKRDSSYLPKPADIWALGVVLFKLLTGKFPFDCNLIIILFIYF